MKLTLSLVTVVIALTSLVLSVAHSDSTSATPPLLASMFTDNMVLQRGQSDPVWGWATPGQSITVSIAGKSASAVVGADGKWLAKLPPLPVGGPYTLTVSGAGSAVLNNVLVGDVWVASGQSNMEFGVGNGLNADQEFAAANYPQVRLFYVVKAISLDPQNDVVGHWDVCTPDTLRSDGDWGGFSAVAYFFARDLYQDLNVPIGIVHTSWGGTPAEAWTSEEALRANMPDFAKPLDLLDENRAEISQGRTETMAQRIADWYAKNDPGVQPGVNWADPAFDDSAWKTMSLPGYFQKAGDPAIANVNGLIWFRRTFDVPAGEAGKDLVLNMLADDNDTTWVNGTQVGATEGAGNQRAYAVAAPLLKPTGNLISVRVLDTGGVGGIYGDPAGLSLTASDGTTIPLAGPWLYKFAASLTAMTAYPTVIVKNPNYPTVLFNAMVNPLIPYGIKGAIWYQGESNAGQAYQYRTLLPTMIQDWRKRWDSNFAFLIVQLAAYQQPPTQPGDDAWAELREAQWMTAQNLKNTGIATAIDIGNANDIHPKNKQEVGRRLALVARRLVYHEKIESSGPVYKSISVDGASATIQFDHLGGGLVTTDGGAPKGFAVAGTDRKWYWADATIVGDTIVVSSTSVPHPVAVRYAWASGPIGNLADRDGLPMFPFRTDHFPALTDWNHVEH